MSNCSFCPTERGEYQVVVTVRGQQDTVTFKEWYCNECTEEPAQVDAMAVEFGSRLTTIFNNFT
jgi:hypothetical protein